MQTLLGVLSLSLSIVNVTLHSSSDANWLPVWRVPCLFERDRKQERERERGNFVYWFDHIKGYNVLHIPMEQTYVLSPFFSHAVMQSSIRVVSFLSPL